MANTFNKTAIANFMKKTMTIANTPDNLETDKDLTLSMPRDKWAEEIQTLVGKACREADADWVKEVETKWGVTFETFVKDRLPPFIIMKLAFDIITFERFKENILSHDTDSVVILDFVPVDDFKDSLIKMNEAFWAYELEPEFDIKAMAFDTPPTLSKKVKEILDMTLEANQWPTTDGILGTFQGLGKLKAQFEAEVLAKNTLIEEMEVLQEQLAEAALQSFQETMITSESKEIPEGKTIRKMVSEIFPEFVWEKDFKVTCFQWEGNHPMVPEANKHYVFRKELVSRVLYALETNQRAYLQGHTGTGKTTLIEQVAARLGYPTIRINFDSEISRMDLIGRDTLKAGESVFVDGLLPVMMSQPCIGIFDEIDFCRPDVAYVMQSALENNSLRITEDGGREVKPHPMFRMMATGNTVGQGDEMGMYQGARPQSLAFLDRFTVWATVDYLEDAERVNLIKRSYPSIKAADRKVLAKYVTEHLEAFTSGKVLQPISPRAMLAIAKAFLFQTMMGEEKAMRQALELSVLDRATQSDRAVLKGLIDRVAP